MMRDVAAWHLLGARVSIQSLPVKAELRLWLYGEGRGDRGHGEGPRDSA